MPVAAPPFHPHPPDTIAGMPPRDCTTTCTSPKLRWAPSRWPGSPAQPADRRAGRSRHHAAAHTHVLCYAVEHLHSIAERAPDSATLCPSRPVATLLTHRRPRSQAPACCHLQQVLQAAAAAGARGSASVPRRSGLDSDAPAGRQTGAIWCSVGMEDSGLQVLMSQGLSRTGAGQNGGKSGQVCACYLPLQVVSPKPGRSQPTTQPRLLTSRQKTLPSLKHAPKLRTGTP